MASSVTEKALEVLRFLPRVCLNNLRDTPGSHYAKKPHFRGDRRRRLFPHKGHKQRMGHARLGFEGGQFPFYLKVPIENYNKGHHLRRQYPPISLQQLQMMIDLGRIDTSQPIDLATLCNTKLCFVEPFQQHFGLQLTDEGIDNFKAKINIEVQHAKEHVIAAIEKNGGVITTAFYDMESVMALVDPEKFFLKGIPIPKRMLPPEDGIGYYSDPKSRGYLADPEQVASERFLLAQKYGYVLPDLSKDPDFAMLTARKDPRQVFYGLEPGWVVNMRDKVILKPRDPEYQAYYNE
uniref:Large ribosomal subunit protein uL15m n=1 Tax=Ornithodoros turicata TaxID=34597 RepID=A0A2R5LKM5_9ACAR